MTFGKNSRMALVALTLSCSGVASANSKTLFVNGVNAAVHGDLSLDQGKWRDEKFMALRVKAGFQLIRVGFVGVTIGFQKVGFYTAERNMDNAETNKLHFDYRGPVEELHLFPDAMFGFSIAAHQGTGYIFRDAISAAPTGVSCNAATYSGNDGCLAATTERSKLAVQELTAQVNYTVKTGLQLFLGVGSRKLTGTPEYHVFRPNPEGGTGDYWERWDQPTWKETNSFFHFGIRGTTL